MINDWIYAWTQLWTSFHLYLYLSITPISKTRAGFFVKTHHAHVFTGFLVDLLGTNGNCFFFLPTFFFN